MRSKKPATQGYVARMFWLGFVLVLVVLVSLMFKASVDSVNDLRAACARGNESQKADLLLADALIRVNQRRIDAEGSTPSEVRANQFAISQYRTYRAAKIAARADVAIEPGTVVADCEAAYDYPWPLG